MLGIAYLCKGLALPQNPGRQRQRWGKGHSPARELFVLSRDLPVRKRIEGCSWDWESSRAEHGRPFSTRATAVLLYGRLHELSGLQPGAPAWARVGPGPAGSAAQPRGRCGTAPGASRRGCRSGPGDPPLFHHWRAATS